MWLHALASQRRGDVNRIDAAAEADRATVGAGALQPPERPADLIDIDGLTPQPTYRFNKPVALGSHRLMLLSQILICHPPPFKGTIGETYKHALLRVIDQYQELVP
jgi:hypothetical protein